MTRQETMSIGQFREILSRYPDHSQVLFGCPDESNPLEFLGVEENGADTVHIKFRLEIYEGRD